MGEIYRGRAKQILIGIQISMQMYVYFYFLSSHEDAEDLYVLLMWFTPSFELTFFGEKMSYVFIFTGYGTDFKL